MQIFQAVLDFRLLPHLEILPLCCVAAYCLSRHCLNSDTISNVSCCKSTQVGQLKRGPNLVTPGFFNQRNKAEGPKTIQIKVGLCNCCELYLITILLHPHISMSYIITLTDQSVVPNHRETDRRTQERGSTTVLFRQVLGLLTSLANALKQRGLCSKLLSYTPHPTPHPWRLGRDCLASLSCGKLSAGL